MKSTLLLFISFFALLSCDREPVMIKSGIETKVFGNLTDYHDTPISNLKIKVGEFKLTTTGSYIVSYDNYEFIDWADSTYTNEKGDYNFTFKTSGKGNFYRLFVGEYRKPNEPKDYSEPIVIDITKSAHDMKYIGSQFEFNSRNMLKLYPCYITFKINNVGMFPLGLTSQFTDYSDLSNFNGNGTFERTIYIQRYDKEIVTLSRRKNNILQTAKYELPASNVETATYQTIIVEEADFKDTQ